MSKMLEAFRTNLEEFAANHKNDIRRNPEFRMQFQEMCATIGVDPLACELAKTVSDYRINLDFVKCMRTA